MYYFILFILFFCSPLLYGQKAVVVVPIANLVGQPMQSFYPHDNPTDMYKKLPFCGAGNMATACKICPRLHQLLFNEIVEVLQELNEEVLVQVPNAFYVTHNTKKKHQTFWTLKQYLAILNTNIDLHKIPASISINNENQAQKQSIIKLKTPFYDPEHKKYYSAGTRFVKCPQKKSSIFLFAYTYNAIQNSFSTIKIPKKICLIDTPNEKSKKIDIFVKTLKEWAHQPKSNIIPYVLGGCSFINTYPAYQFALKEAMCHNNTKDLTYQYNDYTKKIVNGFDCSGIIFRAAQMADIPYFCKNTGAILETLKPLKNSDKLDNGDILCIPGHVMVIADIKKNTIIEARGYDHGYGKIHEIPLIEQFNDIKTCQNLLDAYHTKKALIRLDRKGTRIQTITNYQLLKLASVWDC